MRPNRRSSAPRPRPRLAALAIAALVLSLAGPGPAQETTGGRDTLDFANRLLRDRRYDLAAEEYAAFLKANPDDERAADARYGLASAHLFSGQYAEARRGFEQLLREAPDHPNAASAWFRVGELAYMLGDLPAARTALETYTARYEGHRHQETAWTYLGEVCYRAGDMAEARKAYEHALAAFPKGRLVDRARYGLARTLAGLKDHDGAIAQLEDVIAGGAADWTGKARFQLGLVQLEAGQDADAVATFETLEREAPQSPTVPESRLKRAEALARLDRHDEAVTLLKPLAAGEDRLAPQAAYALASSQLKQDRPDEALATSEDGLKRFADSPLAPLLLFRSAEAAARLDRHDDARERYLRLVETYPKDDWADVALARAAEQALRAGDPDAAGTLAARLREAYPDSPQRAGARLIEAQAALARKKPEEAVSLLESLLADDKPEAATEQAARLALGVAYRAAGQGEKATEILRDLGDAPADAQYVVGAGLFEAKRYDDAIAPLEAYLAGKPDGDVAADALALLALAHHERQDEAQATAALDRLARDFPASKALAKARLRLGEAALDAKDHDRATALLRPVAENEAENADPAVRARALWSLGWAQLEGKKPAEAADSFATLLATDAESPLAPDAALARARALDEANRPEEALAAYQSAGQTYVGTDREARATLGQARLLDRLGRHGEAAKLFEQYLKDHPKPAEGADPTDTVLAQWGWATVDDGRPADAAAIFQRLLDQHPDSPRAADARVVLAEKAHEAGELAAAEQLLKPVIDAEPPADPALVQSALFRLGLIRFDHRDWPGAIARFDRLIADFPDSALTPKARFWKGEAAFQSGDAKTAESAFAAILGDPMPSPATAEWRPTARLRHAESLVALERWSDALAEADAMKADLPDFPSRHELEYARGRALQGLARFDEARAAYQEVIDARRADDFAARAQLMRGETYFHQKQYSDALKEFLRVVYTYDAPPHQAAALLEAGKVAEQLGKWKDAVDFYEKLTTGDFHEKLTAEFPDDPSATAAAARLEAARAHLRP